MRKEDHEHIAQCCVSLQGLVRTNDSSQREFSGDEFDRFIDRLVWAINASPGGRLSDDQKQQWHDKLLEVIEGCVRSSDPSKIIADRLMVLIEDQLAVLEDQRLDFERFVKRCRGSDGS